MHFFTRFPKGVTNPFILSLPEGFTINRKWWGQDGAHWATTHDLRYLSGDTTENIPANKHALGDKMVRLLIVELVGSEQLLNCLADEFTLTTGIL